MFSRTFYSGNRNRPGVLQSFHGGCAKLVRISVRRGGGRRHVDPGRLPELGEASSSLSRDTGPAHMRRLVSLRAAEYHAGRIDGAMFMLICFASGIIRPALSDTS